MSFFDSIKTLLVNAGLITAAGTDFFDSVLPETPDNVVVLFEYDGQGSRKGDQSVTRSYQVMVRNTVAATAKEKCWNIYNQLFHPDESITALNAQDWMIVNSIKCPSRLDWDSKKRTRYVCSLSITTNLM